MGYPLGCNNENIVVRPDLILCVLDFILSAE